MQAGRMRQRVTIQEEAPAISTVGEAVPTWRTVATVWAAITAAPSGSDEQFRNNADQWQARSFYKVTLRYRYGLSVKYRLLWENRILLIHSLVDPTGKRQTWNMIVSEVVQ